MLTRDGDSTGVDVATLAAQLGRRRAAAADCKPLRCGHRDPLTCVARRCHEPPPSHKMLDAAAQAAAHLLTLGLPPILDRDLVRGMWRHGHHRLAQHCYSLAGGDA
jgi:hypothetical protein